MILVRTSYNWKSMKIAETIYMYTPFQKGHFCPILMILTVPCNFQNFLFQKKIAELTVK